MLRWTMTFLIMALVAGVLGFLGITAGITDAARIMFFVFLILFLVSLVRRMPRWPWA